MSWIDQLVKTYDFNAGQPGLTPIFHSTMNAQLVVTVDENADFFTARLIDKKEQEKTIPSDEAASTRTSSPVAYPLFDSIFYIAGDLETQAEEFFAGLNPAKQEMLRQARQQYRDRLSQWCASDAANTYVDLVRRYIEKNTLIADLVKEKVLPVDAAGRLVLTKPKAGSPEAELAECAIFSRLPGGELLKAFTVFEVERQNAPTLRLYEDAGVQKSWIDFTRNQLTGLGFCQVTGQTVPLARLHPKRIRHAADGAKLISGNDNSNFTFRGRFANAEEASAIGMETSLKAHAALRWLLKKQGSNDGGQYQVAWAVASNVAVPDPMADTQALCDDDIMGGDAPLIDIGTAESSALALNRLIAGYSARLDESQLCFIMVDSATPGTLAFRSYRELAGTQYLANLRRWHSGCAWLLRFSKDKCFYGAPSPRDIARAVYGDLKLDDPRLRSTVARLTPCILDGRPLPRDIVDGAVNRCSNPCAMENWEFAKNLGITCALYRYAHSKEREYTMSLDPELKTRDYLYGRLLAVADYLEFSAQEPGAAPRQTNAMRLMASFSERPFTGWNNLHRQLLPYMSRLAANKPGLLVKLEKLMNEIHDAFDPKEFVQDKPLSGEYLLAYYCQKTDFFTKKSDPADVTTEHQGNLE